MAVTFHPLTVQKIRTETPDCVSIWLKVPDRLKETFSYRQGQHLTLRTHINGQEVRRTYSLCSNPASGQWRIAVKQVPEGIFSIHAFTTLKPGDILEALPPNGRFFTELNTRHKKHYMAFAAGSGITPVLSIIETTLQTEPDSSFMLVYGNRNRKHIIFREELEALKNKYLHRFILQYVFSQENTEAPLQQGRIDAAKCRLIFSRITDAARIDTYFLCGPQEMIFTVRDFLEKEGVDSSKIHFELFTTVKTSRSAAVQHTVQTGEPESLITLKLDGVAATFPLVSGNSILDTALDKGFHLPYACKGGVCCACKARLTRGKVSMEVNYGLEPEEIAAGFILTCQSHPLTAAVAVDFDDV